MPLRPGNKLVRPSPVSGQSLDSLRLSRMNRKFVSAQVVELRRRARSGESPGQSGSMP